MNNIPKKKGRKPKNYYIELEKQKNLENNDNTNNNIESLQKDISNEVIEKPPLKKRGRKPKGGKIIHVKSVVKNVYINQNVIIHLKCKLSDIKLENEYDPENINEIENFDIEVNKTKMTNINSYIINDTNLKKNIENINTKNVNNLNSIINLNKEDNGSYNINDNIDINNNNNNNNNSNNDDNDNNIISNKNDKELHKKIMLLNHNLHNNVVKKSACFWCTYEFDNTEISIPKFEMGNIMYTYGNFCSLECACGYLFDENIDTSIKFERYYMLNNLYKCNTKIKPSPKPHYILDKFNGLLTIDEFRDINKSSRLTLLINKPISKVTPELFQDNEDIKINNRIINKNN